MVCRCAVVACVRISVICCVLLCVLFHVCVVGCVFVVFVWLWFVCSLLRLFCASCGCCMMGLVCVCVCLLLMCCWVLVCLSVFARLIVLYCVFRVYACMRV